MNDKEAFSLVRKKRFIVVLITESYPFSNILTLGDFNLPEINLYAVTQTSVSRKKVIDAYPESSKADFLHKEYLNIW